MDAIPPEGSSITILVEAMRAAEIELRAAQQAHDGTDAARARYAEAQSRVRLLSAMAERALAASR